MVKRFHFSKLLKSHLSKFFYPYILFGTMQGLYFESGTYKYKICLLALQLELRQLLSGISVLSILIHSQSRHILQCHFNTLEWGNALISEPALKVNFEGHSYLQSSSFQATFCSSALTSTISVISLKSQNIRTLPRRTFVIRVSYLLLFSKNSFLNGQSKGNAVSLPCIMALSQMYLGL